MAIHYRIVERKNTLPNAKTTTSAYAVPKQVGKVTIKQLAEDIADRTTLHRADVRAVLDVLSVSTLSYLDKGLGVDLGEMGNFSIRLRSKSTEKKADFQNENVVKTSILYTPSVEMKDKLKRISVRNLETLLDPNAHMTPKPVTETESASEEPQGTEDSEESEETGESGIGE